MILLVATRKGAWIFHGDGARRSWRVDGPHLLGQVVNHLVMDPRDGRTLLMAAKTGHLGPTIFRSVDLGKTWKEAARPPAFPTATAASTAGSENAASTAGAARAVSHTFWLEPGHPSEPGVWWAGSSPPGLFRSEDGGVTWDNVAGWNDNPMYSKWVPSDSGTPDGPLLNQILLDPRDARRMLIATSTGGVFESCDAAATWTPLNKGVEANFLPDPYPEYGQDAHYLAQSRLRPDRIYQQNHCGIYRLDKPSDVWERIGRNMPAEVGDIGFSIVVHPRDADSAFVFPMDGSDVWPRTSPGGKPAVYRTSDAGESWQRLDRGFPREQGWFTVKRQAFAIDDQDPCGLYLGTTGGELWSSADEGESWSQIAAHLPEIYSVTPATPS